MDLEDDTVVRCFGCGEWVRSQATEMVQTGERGDIERWCVGCIGEVDSRTKSLLLPGYTSTTLELEEG